MEVCNGLTANWYTIVFNGGCCSTGLGLVSVLLVGDGDGRRVHQVVRGRGEFHLGITRHQYPRSFPLLA